MELYTRRQLTLLLVLVLVAGAGIAIDRWRRAHPEIAERLESLDRAPGPSVPWPASARSTAAPPAPARPERPARTPATPSSAATPLDLNRASRDELERLPGIGPGLAGRIVEARERRGPFSSVDDLRRVRGIGRSTLERVRPRLAIGPMS